MPIFWNCDSFSYPLWQNYCDTQVITAKTFDSESNDGTKRIFS